MTLNANNLPSNSKPQQPFDPGSYPARTVQIIDMGLQPQKFDNEEKPPKNEVMVTYEFLDEFMKDEEGNDIYDKPRWLSETFPLNSLNSEKAKSTSRYYALDPTTEYNGDWSQLLDIPCTVTVVNNPGKGKNKDKVFNKITSVSSMRSKDASRAKPLINDAKFFTLDNPDIDVFLSLPDWVQKKIKDGLEFSGSKLDTLLQKHAGKPVDKKTKKPEPEEDGIPGEEEEENW